MLDGKDDYVDCGDLRDLPSGQAARSIGRQVNDAAEFWDGAVDDVRIYRRALPQSDVKAIMDGKPVPDSSTITVAP
jgi:hypothetical protein